MNAPTTFRCINPNIRYGLITNAQAMTADLDTRAILCVHEYIDDHTAGSGLTPTLDGFVEFVREYAHIWEAEGFRWDDVAKAIPSAWTLVRGN